MWGELRYWGWGFHVAECLVQISTDFTTLPPTKTTSFGLVHLQMEAFHQKWCFSNKICAWHGGSGGVQDWQRPANMVNRVAKVLIDWNLNSFVADSYRQVFVAGATTGFNKTALCRFQSDCGVSSTITPSLILAPNTAKTRVLVSAIR